MLLPPLAAAVCVHAGSEWQMRREHMTISCMNRMPRTCNQKKAHAHSYSMNK